MVGVMLYDGCRLQLSSRVSPTKKRTQRLALAVFVVERLVVLSDAFQKTPHHIQRLTAEQMVDVRVPKSSTDPRGNQLFSPRRTARDCRRSSAVSLAGNLMINVPASYVAILAVLSLCALRRTSGIVMDSFDCDAHSSLPSHSVHALGALCLSLSSDN